MIASEKSHQNHSDYNIFEFYKKETISIEKMRISSNYNYDYAHPFFRNDF